MLSMISQPFYLGLIVLARGSMYLIYLQIKATIWILIPRISGPIYWHELTLIPAWISN